MMEIGNVNDDADFAWDFILIYVSLFVVTAYPV